MQHGRIVAEGTPATIFADLAHLRRLQLAIPEPIDLAARLRAAGFPLSPAAVTLEAIAAEIGDSLSIRSVNPRE
jgi:energy-coupling factor transport system ATP-binding protein